MQSWCMRIKESSQMIGPKMVFQINVKKDTDPYLYI